MSDLQSDSLDKFIPAFIKAQAAMSNAVLDANNPHFKSRYATLASVRSAVMPALWEHGFCVMHQMETVAKGANLITTITHESGQWKASIWPIPDELILAGPQKMGSAIQYGRRYCISSMCGITAEDDDDGAHASKNGAGATAPAPAQDGSKHIYAILSETLRATKTEDEYKAWKASHQEAISSLDDGHFKLMKQLVADHLSAIRPLTGEAAPAPAKTPAKKLSIAERAIAVERDKNAPMPIDEVPF